MKKILILLLSLILLVGCSKNETKKEIKETNNQEEIIEKKDNMLKITINNKEYDINLENNKTVDALIELLPLDLTMEELNGNEKYIYLDTTLPTNPIKQNKINAGDVMLYGNNCLVIFYKSFNTTYSYTKIGHINNLADLGSNNITVNITN